MFPLVHGFAMSKLYTSIYFLTNCSIWMYLTKRKFRTQTSDNMDRWKSRGGKSQRGEEPKKEDQRRESVRRKKTQMQVREKVGKSQNTPDGRLAKALGAEPCGQMRDEKLHAIVARNAFASQNVQSTPTSDHFWQLWRRKSAFRCGAKRICKSKCTKHVSFGALLEVEMSKKCMPLWREAHFQVKMYKAHHSQTTFGSKMPLRREGHFQVKMYKARQLRSTFGS